MEDRADFRLVSNYGLVNLCWWWLTVGVVSRCMFIPKSSQVLMQNSEADLHDRNVAKVSYIIWHWYTDLNIIQETNEFVICDMWRQDRVDVSTSVQRISNFWSVQVNLSLLHCPAPRQTRFAATWLLDHQLCMTVSSSRLNYPIMQHNEGDEVNDQALSDVEQRRGPDDSMVGDEQTCRFSLWCMTLDRVTGGRVWSLRRQIIREIRQEWTFNQICKVYFPVTSSLYSCLHFDIVCKSVLSLQLYLCISDCPPCQTLPKWWTLSLISLIWTWINEQISRIRCWVN